MATQLCCEQRTGEHAGNGTAGHVTGYADMACVAYWAERYTGRGDAVIHYFARREDGVVVTFRKADNRRAGLRGAPDMKWLAPEPDPRHRHGAYGMYCGTIQRSQEYPL